MVSSLLIRDAVLEAAAVSRGSLETSLCLSWSRLCLGRPLPRSCLSLETRTQCFGLGSASLFLAWTRLGLEVSVYEAHELVTFQEFVVHLVYLVNELAVFVVVTDRHYYCTIYWFSSLVHFVFFSRISIFHASVSNSSSALAWPQGCCLCLGLASFPAFTASALSRPRFGSSASAPASASNKCPELSRNVSATSLVLIVAPPCRGAAGVGHLMSICFIHSLISASTWQLSMLDSNETDMCATCWLW